MTEHSKTKDFMSPDTILRKLYEAAPKLTWHVSPSAQSVIRSATEFICLPYPPIPSGQCPPDALGHFMGGWVYEDAELEGRTIELRGDGKVLSSISLEDEYP